MPIGSNAVYAPAGIKDWTAFGVFLEEIIIINKPTAPLTPIKYNGAGWSGGSRCGDQGSTGVSAPLPSNYLVSDVDGNDTPNYPAAVMTADGNNYLQGQPLTHCTAGGPWTWLGLDYSTSIYGDGINGAQGGSHLSSVGGTIRLGEWSSRKIPHVLKTVVDSSNFGNSAGPGCAHPGCRWPAVSSDCGNTACDYTGTNNKLKMGSLLAILPGFNCDGLRTVPGRVLCHAVQDYGMYIVDSGWDPAYLPVEHGPDGTTEDEFLAEFGYDMKQSDPNHPWSQDWRQIVTSAQVVDNNGASSVGGGGTPRAPLAPPIGN